MGKLKIQNERNGMRRTAAPGQTFRGHINKNPNGGNCKRVVHGKQTLRSSGVTTQGMWLPNETLNLNFDSRDTDCLVGITHNSKGA